MPLLLGFARHAAHAAWLLRSRPCWTHPPTHPPAAAAGAAKMIADNDWRDAAAVASRRAGELYGLDVLDEDIQVGGGGGWGVSVGGGWCGWHCLMRAYVFACWPSLPAGMLGRRARRPHQPLTGGARYLHAPATAAQSRAALPPPPPPAPTLQMQRPLPPTQCNATQDMKDNVTRFVVLSRDPLMATDALTSAVPYKTSIVFSLQEVCVGVWVWWW